MTLRDLRIEKNITQDELSAITGVSQQYISKVENGRVRMSRALGTKLMQNFTDLTLEQVWAMMEQVPQRERRGRRGPYVSSSIKR